MLADSADVMLLYCSWDKKTEGDMCCSRAFVDGIGNPKHEGTNVAVVRIVRTNPASNADGRIVDVVIAD